MIKDIGLLYCYILLTTRGEYKEEISSVIVISIIVQVDSLSLVRLKTCFNVEPGTVSGVRWPRARNARPSGRHELAQLGSELGPGGARGARGLVPHPPRASPSPQIVCSARRDDAVRVERAR